MIADRAEVMSDFHGDAAETQPGRGISPIMSFPVALRSRRWMSLLSSSLTAIRVTRVSSQVRNSGHLIRWFCA